MARQSAEIRQGLIDFLRKNCPQGVNPGSIYSFIGSIQEQDLKGYLSKSGRHIVEELKSFCNKQAPPTPREDKTVDGLLLPEGAITPFLLSKLESQMKDGDKICLERQGGNFKIYLEDKKHRQTELRNQLFLRPDTEPVPFSGLIAGASYVQFSAISKDKLTDKETRGTRAERLSQIKVLGLETLLEMELADFTGKWTNNGRTYDKYICLDGTEVYTVENLKLVYAFKEPGKDIQYI